MHVVLKCHIGKCHVMEMNEGTSSEPLMCRHRHDTLDPNQMLVYHLSIKMNYVHSDILRMNFKLFSSVFSALLFEYSHFTDFLILVSVFQNSKYLAHVHSRTTVWVFLGAVSGIDFISNIPPPPKKVEKWWLNSERPQLKTRTYLHVSLIRRQNATENCTLRCCYMIG